MKSKAKGIKTIICNRPDGEGVDQPNIIEIQEAAIRQGIQLEYLPVVSGRVTDEQAIEFKSLYQNHRSPYWHFAVLELAQSPMGIVSSG